MKAEEMVLVSVDDHIAEPASMFEQHVPAQHREHMPRVIEDDLGVQQWWYGSIKGRNLGLNAVAGKPREMYNIDAARYDEMRPGCYDVHERVRDMSAGGYLAALNFPNWTGFSGQVLSEGPDPDINNVMIRAYNDWHVLEWCGAYPDRFIPCGLVPLYDAEQAATEVRRLAAMGCHAVTFSENPEALGRPSIHSGYWDSFFAACCDVGTIICLHLGSSSRPLQMSSDAPVSVAPCLSNARTINTLTELIWSSLWSRFPDIKFALSEGDIGWIPYFLMRAQHVQDVQSGWTMHEFPPGMGPIDIFQRNFLCCFIEDKVGLRLLEYFNIDNLSWESDFPHSDSFWPNAPEQLEHQLEGLSRSTVNKITYQNALRHYQFDPFRTRPIEQCTVEVLRAEAADVDTVTHVGHVNPDRQRQVEDFRSRFRPAAGASPVKEGAATGGA
jgi:predicted TIM-barrel fold metal-dependent hydrolase